MAPLDPLKKLDQFCLDLAAEIASDGNLTKETRQTEKYGSVDLLQFEVMGFPFYVAFKKSEIVEPQPVEKLGLEKIVCLPFYFEESDRDVEALRALKTQSTPFGLTYADLCLDLYALLNTYSVSEIGKDLTLEFPSCFSAVSQSLRGDPSWELRMKQFKKMMVSKSGASSLLNALPELWSLSQEGAYSAEFLEGRVSARLEKKDIYLICRNGSGTLELRYKEGQKTLEHWIPKGQDSCAPYAVPSMQPLASHSAALRKLPPEIAKHLAGNFGIPPT
jgi:hypothetical protein